MTKLRKIKELFKDESGVAMVEYALILAFIGVGFSALLILFRDPMIALFTGAGNKMSRMADNIG